MKGRIRDLVFTIVALSALFMMLASINPGVRDRAGQFTGGLTSQSWGAPGAALGSTVASIVTTSSGYADENVYLFAFLVVACVLFVLMLRT
jgi:hypothetical protein